ncbi:neuroblastoma-amplified sequence-like [Aphis craccivora]|uniref:Neuroblastoma-amplified sequence-like n=1 Tax=Aphis craccivora TaxID=307492 RepID=A0A6G0ZKH0_APHCR|nr:neuroblastoma-amplified sequence-like [Aphis craccivora]
MDLPHILTHQLASGVGENRESTTYSKIKFKIKPWITTDILSNLLHAQSRKKPYDLLLKDKYKKYRNNLISDIKNQNFYEDSLKKIVTWFSNNNLTLNNNKTVFLTFSNTSRTTHNVPTLKIHAPTCNLYIQCNCSHINRTDYTKYLGVIFDQHLRWNLHTTELNLKLRKLYTFYTMAKQFLNTHWLKNTYFALSQSIIEYGIVAWGGASQTHTAQNTILKIIFRKPRKTLFYLFQNNIIQTTNHNYNTRTEMMIKTRPRSRLSKSLNVSKNTTSLTFIETDSSLL